MRRAGLRVGLLAVAAFSLSGCALLLLGAGATAGYAVSKDSVRNHFDLSREFVFNQSLAVAKQMGMVSVEDPAHGLIRMNVGEANVTITVKPVTKKTVELKVKARNQLLMPQLGVAHQVYNKILERLD